MKWIIVVTNYNTSTSTYMYDIKYIKWVIVFFVESSQVVIVPVLLYWKDNNNRDVCQYVSQSNPHDLRDSMIWQKYFDFVSPVYRIRNSKVNHSSNNDKVLIITVTLVQNGVLMDKMFIIDERSANSR